METFKDNLTKIFESKKEKEKIEIEKNNNEEIYEKLNYVINHLLWLKNNYKKELEILSNKGYDSWDQKILGKSKKFIENINIDYKRIKEHSWTKNLDEFPSFEEFRLYSVTYSKFEDKENLCSKIMKAINIYTFTQSIGENNYEELFIKFELAEKFEEKIKNSTEFRLLVEEFNNSDLKLNLKKHKISSLRSGLNQCFLTLDTYWGK